jgi:hypothetical protein
MTCVAKRTKATAPVLATTETVPSRPTRDKVVLCPVHAIDLSAGVNDNKLSDN